MSKTTGTPTLDIEGVHKAFGSYVAVENVDLKIWPGEFIALIREELKIPAWSRPKAAKRVRISVRR